MTWKSLAAATLLLGLATPSLALFDPGNVGLPTGNPAIFDPNDPPTPPPPPPTLPPLGLRSFGLTFIEFSVRPPAGRTSQLFKQPPGGAYAPFRSVTPGVELVIRDENLGVGKSYCYRLVITGGTQPEETHTRCQTTDWRVGFEQLAMTENESAAVLRLFDWRDTQPLAEGTPDEPALYHMNLLIDDGDPLAEQGFRYLGMHVQGTPIFAEEAPGFNPTRNIAKDCTDPFGGQIGPVATTMARSVPGAVAVRPGVSCTPAGRWFYAAVPGRVYNEIRSQMLDQISRGLKPGVRALVFRKVPVAAALPVGVSRHSLSIVYLGQQGLQFNAIQQCTMLDGLRVCTIQQELLGWIARKVVKWVAELGDAVVQGVRQAIGRITRLIKGEVELEIQLVVMNTDPAFGENEVMRSGWSGEEVHLEGVKVEVRQGMAIFIDDTNSTGFAHMKVAKNRDTTVCIQVENETAEITEYLLEATVCVKELGSLSADRHEIVEVRNGYVNTLAAMSDARKYLQDVGGFTMPKITVVVGSVADTLSPLGRSYTPCAGRVPSLIGGLLDVISAWNPGSLAFAVFLEFHLSVDIVLQSADDASRGVAVHEYGHAVMCELMMRQSIATFSLAWLDVIAASRSQDADNSTSYIAEGWADFITAQVMGGTNYFATSSVVSSESINYCKAASSCVEQNFKQSSDFTGQVARVTSLLQDAFDGGAGANDASHWREFTHPPATPDPDLVHDGALDSDFSDEPVALAGTDLESLFEHWDDRGTLLGEDTFLGGLADLVKARGFSEAEACQLFELHDSSASCPGFVARRQWLGWLDPADSAVLSVFAAAPAPLPGGAPTPTRTPALLTAIAAFAPAPAPGTTPPPGEDPPAEEPCVECAPPVVLEGVQKISVPSLGKSERDTAFAFRLGEGSFEGIDPLGQLYEGAWDARNAKGSKVRLHLGPEQTDALARLLAESALDLGADTTSLQPDGPAKIELRLAKNGTLVGKITVKFTVEVEGRVKRGSYVAKLVGASA